MDIDYTVAALMFPAIPLMMTMYSNRYHTLSALIRRLHDQYIFEKRTQLLSIERNAPHVGLQSLILQLKEWSERPP